MTCRVSEMHLGCLVALPCSMEHLFFVKLPLPDLVLEVLFRQCSFEATRSFSNEALVDEFLKLTWNNFVGLPILDSPHLSVLKGNFIYKHSFSSVRHLWLLFVNVMEFTYTHDFAVSELDLTSVQPFCLFNF